LTLNLVPLAITALDRAALALIIGAAASWVYLLAPQRAAPLYSAPLPLLGAALVLMMITGAGDLIARTAALADVGLTEAWPYVGRALTHSDYGTFWQVRLATWLLLIILALWLSRHRGSRAAAWGVAAGAAVITFVFSSTGHAGDGGSLTLPNLMNVLHIAGGCLWGGTVIVYAARILPRARHDGLPAPTIALTADRLSTLAGAALALVLATGVYNAWRQLPHWSALWETDYGRTLLVKLAAVAVMMAIGAFNRYRAVPAIGTWARQTAVPAAGGEAAPVRRFLRLLRIDALVFLFVLAAAAVLGAQTPPAHMAAAAAVTGAP
jgi:putative copper resistance protein D